MSSNNLKTSTVNSRTSTSITNTGDSVMTKAAPTNIINPMTIMAPLLIVALGGTGRLLALIIRRLFIESGMMSNVRIIVIDSDLKSKEGLSENEFFLLETEPILDMLAHPEENQFIINRFELWDQQKCNRLKTSIKTDQSGAAQQRPIGALAWAANIRRIRLMLSNAIRQLNNPCQNLETIMEGGTEINNNSPMIILLSSLAGGTGSGCLTDCLALLRHESQNLIPIDAYLVSPGVYKPYTDEDPRQWRYMVDNSITCIREINSIREGILEENLPFFYNKGDILIPCPSSDALRRVYLVSNQDSKSQVFSPDVVFNSVARHIFAATKTEIGPAMKTRDCDVQAFPRCHRTDSPRDIASLGTLVIEYPRKDILEFSIANQYRDFFKFVLAGPQNQNNNNNLHEDQQATAQILKFNSISAGTGIQSPSEVGRELSAKLLSKFTPTAKVYFPTKDFLFRYTDEFSQLPQRAKIYREANCPKFKDQFEQALEKARTNISFFSATRGINYSISLLDGVIKELKSIRVDLKNIREQNDSQCEEFRAKLNAGAKSLKETWWYPWTPGTEKIQAQMIADFHEYVRKNLTNLLYEQYSTSLNEAITGLDEDFRRYKALCSNLTQTVDKAEKCLQQLRDRKTPMYCKVSGVINPVLPSFRIEFYADNRVDPGTMLENLAKRAGVSPSVFISKLQDKSVQGYVVAEAKNHFKSLVATLNILDQFEPSVWNKDLKHSKALETLIKQFFPFPMINANRIPADEEVSDLILFGVPSESIPINLQNIIDKLQPIVKDNAHGANITPVLTRDPGRLSFIRRSLGYSLHYCPELIEAERIHELNLSKLDRAVYTVPPAKLERQISHDTSEAEVPALTSLQKTLEKPFIGFNTDSKPFLPPVRAELVPSC